MIWTDNNICRFFIHMRCTHPAWSAGNDSGNDTNADGWKKIFFRFAYDVCTRHRLFHNTQHWRIKARQQTHPYIVYNMFMRNKPSFQNFIHKDINTERKKREKKKTKKKTQNMYTLLAQLVSILLPGFFPSRPFYCSHIHSEWMKRQILYCTTRERDCKIDDVLWLQSSSRTDGNGAEELMRFVYIQCYSSSLLHMGYNRCSSLNVLARFVFGVHYCPIIHIEKHIIHTHTQHTHTLHLKLCRVYCFWCETSVWPMTTTTNEFSEWKYKMFFADLVSECFVSFIKHDFNV